MNIMNTDLAKETHRVAIALGKNCDYFDISYMNDTVFLYARYGDKSIRIEIYQRDNGVSHCYARTYRKQGDAKVLQDRLLEGGTIGELSIAVQKYLSERKAA